MAILAEKIEREITPLVKELGCEVVKVSLFGQTGRKVLQVLLERPDGTSVNIDDCQRISRALSLKLDVMDVITSKYTLEISSAGIDRPLVKPADFVRFCGKNVVVKTYVPKAERKTFKGSLKSATENGIKLKLDVPQKDGEDEISLLYEEISSAHIDGNKE